MSLLQVSQIGNPLLLEKAAAIPVKEIATATTQQLIENMIETLKDAAGVGLAAPQVYEKKRIILIHLEPTSQTFRKTHIPLTVIINPEIVKKSPEIQLDWEGCLSISHGNLLGLVPRHKRISIKGYNRMGKQVRMTASAFKARIIQHEIDHLDGILFFDRMRQEDLKNLSNRKEWLQFHRSKWPKPLSL